ncbi:prenyltransferase/squalene oxidase repeat-containing protein [Rubinisphaera margarita]|uniref:prenyltransferase/squalene oxidase repeat-containing protein n=1 Tax=Rubinisphaera margarita TaxID=2909586 RepID=UPI001EE9A496|nr:prenyltransferase/squalene oxidase repeat-containing protein [Rubinisphaera margarita]MCG6155919.1 terpene cyclase/mutase family protein [Rubinisphaera margarita]
MNSLKKTVFNAFCGVFVVLSGFPVSESNGQEKSNPYMTATTQLSDALPPQEWSRIESAVDSGLEWLASQQAEDGRFPSSENAQPAVTAMAVMAFLSRGHIPDQGPYGRQISKAIDFTLSTQSRRGYFSMLPVVPPSHHLNPAQTVHYNHAITGLMLGEVYGMTTGEQSRRVEAALARALLYHREVQTWQKGAASDHGGWRYGYPEGPNASADMSVTGWALMFLRSARNAEFNIPKLYFDEGLDFVQRCYEDDVSQHESGVFRYRPRQSDPNGNPQITLANTSSATLTLILGGRQDHPGVVDSIRWLRSREYPRFFENGYFYLATYYTSQAVAQVGGDTWNQLFPQIASNLLEVQNSEGHWRPGIGKEELFGECYSTSLAVLALTPAYQLLPIYQR